MIEDDEALLESLSLGIDLLSDELELVTVKATDGKEALKLCEDYQFQAVITDYSMPNMDGMEFIKEFRKLTENKTIPIIFTSGFFSELNMDENKNMFEDVIFIEKPYSISKINSFLKLYLKSDTLD